MKQYFFLILLLPFILIPAYAYNSGFQPVYQPNGGGAVNLASIHQIGNVTEIGCAVAQFLSVNSTGFWSCATGGSGEINTASNSGHGNSLVLPKVGVDLPFKGIACTGSINCNVNTTDITIDYTATGGGNATLLNDLGDVATVPVFGEVLYWDGATWVEHLLILQQDIYDVSITLAERGDFLWNDGTNWIDLDFGIDSITCAAGTFVNVINNQTGATSCGSPTSSGFTKIVQLPPGTATILHSNSSNTAEIKSLTQGTGITLTNGTQTITIATTPGAFKNTLLDGSNHTDTTAQAPTRGSIIYADATPTWNELVKGSSGQVLTSGADDVSWVTPSTDSGIPLPPKRWGELIPTSASASLEGLLTGCTISATASYAYNVTDKVSGIVSTTAVTDGVNGGISCVATDRHVYRGDQNAYMYSAWSENKITTNRIFIGFTSSSTILPNNADTILDAISGAGLCIRTTDTVYQFCSNDGTGAMAVASLTTTENDGYHYFEVYTTDSGVTWCGALDGGTAVCSSTAANIPAVTTRLYAMSSGETDGGVTAIIWRQYLMYTTNDK